MRMGCRRLLWLTGFLIITLGSFSFSKRVESSSRRCLGEAFSNTNATSRQGFISLIHNNTTCTKCAAASSSNTQNNLTYRISIIVSQTSPEFISLAAGLLNENLKVTILSFSSEDSIHDDVLTRVPCKQESTAKSLLTVSRIDINETCENATAPLDSCSLESARSTLEQLQIFMQQEDELPHVLVMDSTLTGGLLLSESLLIPTVTLSSHTVLPLALEHDVEWSPDGNIIFRAYLTVKQRWYSLSLTRSFMHLNRIRRELRLKPLRAPMHYFEPVVATFVEVAPPVSTNRVRVSGFLQPPCTPCIHQPNSHNETVLLVAHPPNMIPAVARDIIRGLSLARASLQSYDDCEWDSLACAKKPNNFTVIWLETGEESNLPPIIPTFIKVEPSTSILDSLARHPTTAAVVAYCDPESTILESLGFPLLCLSYSDRLPQRDALIVNGVLKPRELAVQLLGMLRRPEGQTNATDADIFRIDGLSNVVSLIQRVAHIQQTQGPWDDVAQIQRVISSALENRTHLSLLEDPFEHAPYDTFTVLVAWLVILACVMYIALKDALSSHWRQRRTNHAVSDGILTRLPDLDCAWSTMVNWYREQPSLMRPDSMILPTAPEPEPPRTPNHGGHGHHHGHLRRRRKR